MYLEPWMLGGLFVWWLASVYAISKKEREKSFAVGLSLGVKYTITGYVKDRTISYKRVCASLIDDLNSGAVQIEDYE
jgi:TolB-like protein